MLVLDAEQTAKLLPYPQLAETIEHMLRLHQQGEIEAPPRHHLTLPNGGTLLVMPVRGQKLAVTKVVSVHPENKQHGLPSIQGEVLVLDARDGRRLAMLDGITVTARRTAALSLLAARKLAPNPKGPVLVFGAGAQARAHLEALKSGLDVYQAFVCSRTPDSAHLLAEEMMRQGMVVKVVEDPAEALPQCPLVVTATTSRTPVLPEKVRDDAMIIAVGAFRPDMAEIPAHLVRECAVYEDTPDALHEAGDLIQAGLSPADVTPLVKCLDMPRPEQGPVLFKSTGHSVFDLAAARLAVEQLSQDSPEGDGPKQTSETD